MAVSKKQPAKKRQKKKSSLWIISLIAVILLILVGVVFLVLPKFRKEAAPEKPETIKVEAAEKSYAAGSRLSEKNFRVYGISGKKKQLLDADTYSVSPAKVPAHGHSVTVEVSSKAYPDIKAEITVLIDRDESVRYKIGRENPDDVEAILYSNGDLEIAGKGSVRNFNSNSAPWKKYPVQRLTWIDPEAEVESMDYWFTGNDEYLETLCRIPDTVRSMVETFKNATAMTSMPDMSGAVRLEDITSCAEGCIALEKAMELPGNIKQAKKAFYGDTALIEGADTTACMQLENMDSMYYGCVALASVQIPDSAKELSNICNGCVNLKEVHQKLQKAKKVADSITEEFDSEVKLLKAELLLNGGKLEEAQWLLSTIADADELETIIDVVFLYLDMGYPDAAKEWLDRGKSRYTEDEEYMALTADYLASTHQVESAIIYYNKLIDKSPFSSARFLEASARAWSISSAHSQVVATRRTSPSSTLSMPPMQAARRRWPSASTIWASPMPSAVQ